MDLSALPEIGIGGIFAILVIKEVLSFVKNRNGNTPITNAAFEDHKKSVQYKDNCIEIQKAMLVRFDNIDRQLSEVKELVKQ